MSLLFLVSFLFQQGSNPLDPKAFEGIDQKRVDEAVADGVTHLKRIKDQKGDPKTDELVLLTLISAGVPADDPTFDTILKRMLSTPLEETYRVSLQAMALEKLDPLKFQPRIFECAQFLADNQHRGGMWSYGAPVAPVRLPTPTAAPKPGVTRAMRKLTVAPRAGGEAKGDGGDFSNTQYAALGLRACHDAGIVFPKEFLQKARQAWIDGQQKADTNATGVNLPRGWGYRMGQDGYGSMTAGGVGAVVLYDALLGLEWKRDPAVLSGLAWLAAHFTVEANPEKPGYFHHYYLYGLERAGILFGTEKVGPKYWYREGAKFLLESQIRGGAWRDEGNGGNGWGESLRDTCFSILFLRRATKPLVDVASVDHRK